MRVNFAVADTKRGEREIMNSNISKATEDEATNFVGALSAEIERVRLKQERWKGYMAADAAMAVSLQLGYQIMVVELAGAREALNSGEIVPMIAALQTLRGYSDDD
jgi:hypothetical protein